MIIDHIDEIEHFFGDRKNNLTSKSGILTSKCTGMEISEYDKVPTNSNMEKAMYFFIYWYVHSGYFPV